MSSSSAPFSYAQAAKGQSTPKVIPGDESVKSTQTSVGASEQEQDLPEKDLQAASTTNTAQESVQTLAGSNSIQPQAVESISPENSVEAIKHAVTHEERTRASSPSASSNAATKSIKGDDVSATPAESESTWERNSHISRTELPVEKLANDHDDRKLSTNEQAKSEMKEAPLPAVNVWSKPWENVSAQTTSKSFGNAVKTDNPELLADRDSLGRPAGSKGSVSGSHSVPIKSKPEGASIASSTTAIKQSTKVQPPLDSDASAWPTPDSAKMEEKKAGTGKPEHSDKSSTRPHGKEKWEKVPYVPSAVFATPLPNRGGVRGGRLGGRGGREGSTRGGHSSTTGHAGEHSISTTEAENQTTAGSSNERVKQRDLHNLRGGMASRPKRSSSAGVATIGEPGNDGSYEKRESFSHRAPNPNRSNDARQFPNSIQPDKSNENGHYGTPDAQKRPSVSSDANGETRFSRPYQPRSRDPGAEHNGYVPSRDRGEGRSERGGRGGWRGKSNGQPHGNYVALPHYQQQFPNGKPYSEQRHNSHPAPFPNPREPRHSRTNSRSQSIPNGQAYSRFAVGNMAANGLPALQTDIANAMPMAQQPAVMSAVPYQHFVDHPQLPAMVQMQLEYYFSIDNLCKDTYLRARMDSQGFAPLPFIANFGRIKTLTMDMNMLKWACASSKQLELVTTQDGYDLVRKAEGWQTWVLPFDQREPSAKNDGPTKLISPRFESFPPAFNHVEAYTNMPHSVPISPANHFMMNGYRGEVIPGENNAFRGTFQSSIIQTPLSADVPDFQPAGGIIHQGGRFRNPLEPEQNFPTSQIDQLRLYVDNTSAQSESTNVVTTEATTNGTLDHKSDEDTAKKLNGINGESHAVNGVAGDHEALSKLTNGHSTQSQAASKTIKGRITWSTSSKHHEGGETYHSLRTRVRQQQSLSGPGTCTEPMKDLYEFWATFLTNNFDIQLYQDFHGSALEDANLKQSLIGLEYLTDFYAAGLRSDVTLPERLLKDFTDLAFAELSNQHSPAERPALTKLRQVWANGEASKENRVMLSQKIDEPLKTALGPAHQSP